MKDEQVPVDSLVRGVIGHTRDQVRDMRVTRVSPWGWVVGYNEETGKQHIMNPGFEVIGSPRPEKERRGIPERLR